MSHSQENITFDQVKAAIVFPFQNFSAVIRMGLFPVLLSIGILTTLFSYFDFSIIYISIPIGVQQFQINICPFEIISNIVVIIFGSMLAVGVHRHIILGEKSRWVFFRFSKLEFAYSMSIFLITASMITLWFSTRLVLLKFLSIDFVFSSSNIPNFSHKMVTYAFWGVSIWLCIKSSLVLPNAAVTGRVSLAMSWLAIKGTFWRILGYTVFLFITYSVLYMIYILSILSLSPIIGFAPGSPFNYLYFTPAILWKFFFVVFLLAYFSYVYRLLIEKQAQAD